MDLTLLREGTATLEGTLRSIGEGIGAAAQAIVTESKSDLGTLVVKEAEVTVELELTVMASESGVEGGFGDAGVRGFRIGTYDSKEQAVNRVTITLKAVAVTDAPVKEPATDAPVLGGGGAKPPESRPRWPFDRWDDKTLRTFIDLAEKLAASVAHEGRDLGSLGRRSDPAPGDGRLLAPLGGVVADLLQKLDGSSDADQQSNAGAVEVMRLLLNLGHLLTQDDGKDIQIRLTILSTVAAIDGYFKGVLSAGRTWG